MSGEDHPGQAEPTLHQPTAPAELPLTRWQKFRMVVKVVELRLRFIALMAATGLVFAYWDTLWNHYDKWTRPPGRASRPRRRASSSTARCTRASSRASRASARSAACRSRSGRRAEKADAPRRGHGPRGSWPRSAWRRRASAPSEVAYAPLSETLTTVGYVEFGRAAAGADRLEAEGQVAGREALSSTSPASRSRRATRSPSCTAPSCTQATQELLTRAALRAAGRGAEDRAGPLGPGRPAGPGPPGVREAPALGAHAGADRRDPAGREGRPPDADPRADRRGGLRASTSSRASTWRKGGDMFEVADLDHVWIKAQVYEDQVALVRVGQAVEATVEAFPGEVFPGTVAFIDPSARPRDPDGRRALRPGEPRPAAPPGDVRHGDASRPRWPRRPLFRSRVAAADGGPTGVSLTRGRAGDLPGDERQARVDGRSAPGRGRGAEGLDLLRGCESKLKAKPAKYLARLAPAPTDAVLTVPGVGGHRHRDPEVVYVETEPGVFEGREVVLGPRSGDRYPVLEGLAQGETVAAAGSFLIDAETRLNPAAPAPARRRARRQAEAKARSARRPRPMRRSTGISSNGRSHARRSGSWHREARSSSAPRAFREGRSALSDGDGR